MGIRGQLGLAAVMAAACFSGAAQNASASQAPRRVITTAREVHSLPVEQAALGYPVRLRAVVTCYDPYIDVRHGALFLDDATGGIFAEVAPHPILSLKPGAVVEVSGVTGPGDFAPVILASQVRLVGQSSLPANPRRVTLTQMLTGALDSQWVELEGRVRSVHFTGQILALQIATDDGSFDAVAVREPGVNYDAFVDSLIRIRGDAAAVFNTRRQMVGVRMFFPTVGQIRVIQPAPRDPFTVPAVPISELFRFSPEPGLLHRVHVQGTVTLDWPGRMLCIQQLTDGVCMQTMQDSAVPVGAFVDVVGFPAVSLFKPTLEDVVFRAAHGRATPPQPALVTAGQAIQGNLEGRLVQMDAEFIGRDWGADAPTLLLRSNGVLVPAFLPRNSALGVRLPWKEGSLVRVTGVGSVQVDPLSTNLGEGTVRPQSLHILLRTVDDVAVLRAPSWWNPEHALQSLAVIGLLVLASLTWIVVLRHRVEQQTLALRSSQERLRHLSEHDALTGLPNRLLLNDRLQTALKRAQRFESCLGLLWIDLDEFKRVNDVLGHQAGDAVLCDLAGRLNDCVRSTDTVARLGGDEFIVLLPDLRVPPEAEMIASKIVSAISSPVRIDQTWATVTVSVGVVTCPPAGPDPESLLECADQAMYAAKERGKNCFQVYRPHTAKFGAASEQVLREAQASGA